MESKCNCKCGCGFDKKPCVESVCDKPICGRPEYLSIYAPVVYDEIGINICRTITIPADVLAANPTTACVQLEVASLEFTAGSPTIPGTTVTNTTRANCSTLVITNVAVIYRVKLFDNCYNYLTSTNITANYLPGNAASPDYDFMDTETNPESVTINLYTPYGVSYTDVTLATPTINTVDLIQGSNTIVNGINANAVAKAMNYNPATGTLSAGISLFLRTVYFEVYKLEHEGKPVPPKASLTRGGNTCLDFVESGLLSREIKPLELEKPKCESRFKDDEDSICEKEDCTLKVCNKCKFFDPDDIPCKPIE